MAGPGPSGLAAALRGDAATFERLVRDHAGALLATARRYLGDEAEAEQAVRDAFSAAVAAAGDLPADARPGPWLRGLLLRTVVGRLRERPFASERPIEDFLPVYLEDGAQADPAALWREPAAQALAAEQVRQSVRDCLAQLPAAHRLNLMLADVDGLKPEQIAGLLGVKPGVVRNTLHASRMALRTLLDPHFRMAAP